MLLRWAHLPIISAVAGSDGRKAFAELERGEGGSYQRLVLDLAGVSSSYFTWPCRVSISYLSSSQES